MTEKETEGRLAQIELADAVAEERARRANAALIGPGRFSLPEDATDPRFAAVEGRTVAEKRAEFAEVAGALAIAQEHFGRVFPAVSQYRRFVEQLRAENIPRAIDVVPAPGQVQPIASDTTFLGHVDELLRWAQGHTDRDLLRDRICRELGPLLRERQGKSTK